MPYYPPDYGTPYGRPGAETDLWGALAQHLLNYLLQTPLGNGLHNSIPPSGYPNYGRATNPWEKQDQKVVPYPAPPIPRGVDEKNPWNSQTDPDIMHTHKIFLKGNVPWSPKYPEYFRVTPPGDNPDNTATPRLIPDNSWFNYNVTPQTQNGPALRLDDSRLWESI
jgi:hypothetical protein